MRKPLLYIFIFCIPFIGLAQAEITDPPVEKWEFELTPYLWLTGLEGEMSFFNQSGNLDLEFTDLLNNMKFAAMFRGEARKGDWILLTDITYANLNANATLSEEGLIQPDVEVDLKQTIIELGGGYSFIKNNGFTFDGLLGVRFFKLNTTVNKVGIGSEGERKIDFVDPYLGLRIKNVWNKFALGGYFDVGGFGIGSDLSYKYNVITGYGFSELFELQFGYQGYKPDYQSKAFNYNVGNAGFFLGFNFRF